MDRDARSELRKSTEHAMAGALRRASAQLNADTCTAYLLTKDRRTLTAAVTVDSPLSFAIPVCFDAEDLSWPIVRAYRTGRAVAAAEQELQRELADPLKSSVSLAVPFLMPLSVACAPIRTAAHSYGALSLRWIPPQTIEPADLETLEQIAAALSCELEALDARGADITAPFVPVFAPRDLPSDVLPSDVGLADDGRGLGPGEARKPSPAAISAERGSYLYQLQRLATELATAVRVEEVLAVAQERVIRPFGGKAFAVWLVERDQLHVVGAAGFPREVIRDMDGMPLSSRSPETDAMNSARVRIFPSAQAVRQEYPDTRLGAEGGAIGYFPLLRAGAAAGCCVVEFSEPRERLSPMEATLLTFMLVHVGQSFGRARSNEVENALTRTIQRSMLPRRFPHIPEIVATARYIPVTEGIDVGGGWYDVLTLPDGRIGLVIGDVEGHNLEAAAVMGQLRSGVRAYAAEGHEPAAVLERSNRLLIGLETGLHATCCCMWLDVATGIATIASAGHPGPLVSSGPLQLIRPDIPSEPPLGVEASAEYRERTFRLQPGSVTALFTDGLSSSRGDGAALENPGRALAEYVHDDLEVLADRVISDSRNEHGFDDDATLMLVRYEGAQPDATPSVARMSVQRGDLHGVSEVRGFLRDLFAHWDLAPVEDDIQVMTSEVVTNSLVHARSAVDLRLRRYADRIRVEVQDSDPSPPVPTALLEDEAGNEEAESGRGLLIVDVLAQAWGSSPSGRGKITWFEVQGTPSEPPTLAD